MLIASALLYVTLAVVLALGSLRMRRSRALADDACPHISVVVCARNEERDLPACIASLRALDYPRDKLEVLLVDDASTDATPIVIASACREDARFVALDTRGEQGSPLRAKARALATGIRAARGEWVLVTDADARVPTTWARHLLDGADASVGAIAGAVFTLPSGLVGFCEWWIDCLIVPAGFGVAAHGGPAPCIGANMAFRREPYERLGGLDAIGRDRVGEDLAIFELIARAGLKARAQADATSMVRVAPVGGFSLLLSKWRRWFLGTFDAPAAVWLPIACCIACRTVFAVALLASLILRTPDALLALALGTFANASLLAVAQWRFDERKALLWAPLFELFSCMMWPLYGASLVISRKVRWRGAGYVVRYGDS